MKILIDRNGLQARQHLRDKLRLSTFLTELMSNGRSVAFSGGATLTGDELQDCDVLVITTRSNADYQPQEIEDIVAFVRDGGGLLLLSNHADWSRNPNDTRKHDQRLASEFGVTIERTFFASKQSGLLARLQGPTLNDEHPIIRGPSGDVPIRSIVTHTSASIVSEVGTRVISLSDKMIDKRTDLPPSNKQLLAHALDAGKGPNPSAKGRVVTVADSGLMGSVHTKDPGRGLLELDDNLRFVMNAIRWLGGELGA